MTRAEAASLGGKARAAKLSAERRSEIARIGFNALTSKRFGGVRSKAVAQLRRAGKYTDGRSTPQGTAADLQSLHARLYGTEGPGGTFDED